MVHPFNRPPPHTTVRSAGAFDLKDVVARARAAAGADHPPSDPKRFVESGVGLIIHRPGKPDEVTK